MYIADFCVHKANKTSMSSGAWEQLAMTKLYFTEKESQNSDILIISDSLSSSLINAVPEK